MAQVAGISTSAREMFGGPAYVAAGLVGDPLWVDIGLTMRASIKVEFFTSALENQIGQITNDSLFMAVKSGTCTLTLRNHNARIMAAMFPDLSTRYDDGYGWNANARHIRPTSLHIRPQLSYGTNEDNDASCWWIPVAIPTEIGEWVYKLEDTSSSNEDYQVTFMFGRLEDDYTPGAGNAIAEPGRILYQGNTTNVAAASWEQGLPPGYKAGYPGPVKSASTNTITATGFKVDWEAPDDNGSVISSYRVWTRKRNSGEAFTVANQSTAATTELAITSLTTKTEYEIRVAAVSAAGFGQQVVIFETTT